MNQIQDNINVLYKKGYFFSRSLRTKKIQALSEIAEIGGPFNVSSLFPFVFSVYSNISNKAAQVICQLMSKVRCHQWTQLYQSFQYIELSTKSVHLLTRFPEEISTELLGVASLNGNGYVREAALRKLRAIGHAKALPYVILRLADWVNKIQNLAIVIVREFLKAGFAHQLIQYWYLVDWLEKVQRFDLSSIRNDILEALTLENSHKKLLENLQHSDPQVRLFCYRVLKKEVLENSSLIDEALKDRSPHVRWWISKEIIQSESLKKNWLQQLIKDSSSRIRTSAIVSVSGELWTHYEHDVLHSIFDNSPSVRNTARYLLSKHKYTDFAKQYRQKLLHNEDLCPGWISGLAETGSEGDFEIIERYACHCRSKIRAAAITGMGRLDKKKTRIYAMKALEDASSRVRCVAVGILKDTYDSSIREKIYVVLTRGTGTSRIAASRVLAEQGCWEALAAIIIMLAQGTDNLTDIGWNSLFRWHSRWYTQSWNKPSEELAKIIKDQFNRLKDDVEPPENLRKHWRDLLKLLSDLKLSK